MLWYPLQIQFTLESLR